MTAFVILHYRAIDYTRKCVECIKALEGSKHIIIVDNASPDGTGAASHTTCKNRYSLSHSRISSMPQPPFSRIGL